MLPLPSIVRRQKRRALYFATCFGGGLAGLSLLLPRPEQVAFFILLALMLWFGVYRAFTATWRRRQKVLQDPFPREYADILWHHVLYYRGLDPAGQLRFRQMVQIFLAEFPITGIQVSVAPIDRVLVAASAVIPIMGFSNWEYQYLGEVLLYPESFNRQYATESGEDRNILGMVSGNLADGTVILSQPALRQGFRNPGDKRNVGVHEFVHVIDKNDGMIDGLIPSLGKELVEPWLDFIDEAIQSTKRDRDINGYARTNRQEYLAVTAEYFFERPNLLLEKHPEIYRYLCALFQQEPHLILARAAQMAEDAGEVGRNDPCPCGSGRKYKKCCLTAAPNH